MVLVYGKIYLITCSINEKKYVGQTVSGLKLRLRNHVSHALAFLSGKYKGQDTPLFRAIRKYGREAFRIELLCSCTSKEELDLMEDLYIGAFDTMNKKVGYNLKRGGAHGKLSQEVKDFCGRTHLGFKHSLESRRKMSESTKKSSWSTNRPPMSEEARKRLRDRPPRPPLSEESRQRLRERFQGEKSCAFNHEVKTEDLIHLYLDGEGKSCAEISKIVPMTDAGIRKRLRSAGVKMRLPWEKLHKDRPGGIVTSC